MTQSPPAEQEVSAASVTSLEQDGLDALASVAAATGDGVPTDSLQAPVHLKSMLASSPNTYPVAPEQTEPSHHSLSQTIPGEGPRLAASPAPSASPKPVDNVPDDQHDHSDEEVEEVEEVSSGMVAPVSLPIGMTSDYGANGYQPHNASDGNEDEFHDAEGDDVNESMEIEEEQTPTTAQQEGSGPAGSEAPGTAPVDASTAAVAAANGAYGDYQQYGYDYAAYYSQDPQYQAYYASFQDPAQLMAMQQQAMTEAGYDPTNLTQQATSTEEASTAAIASSVTSNEEKKSSRRGGNFTLESGPPVGHPLWEEQQRKLKGDVGRRGAEESGRSERGGRDRGFRGGRGGAGVGRFEGGGRFEGDGPGRRSERGGRGGFRGGRGGGGPFGGGGRGGEGTFAQPGTVLSPTPDQVAQTAAAAQAAHDAGMPENPHQFHPVFTVAMTCPPGVISKLPPNARLFLGNLASERTTKYEVAAIFAHYGNIVEILLKGSFGFVQFTDPVACQEAIRLEQGRMVGGLNLDLKVSRDKAFSRRAGAEAEDDFSRASSRYDSRDSRDSRDRRDDRDSRDSRRNSKQDDRDSDDGGRRHGSRSSVDRYAPRDRTYDRDRDRDRERDRDRDHRGGGRGSRRSASPPSKRSSRWGDAKDRKPVVPNVTHQTVNLATINPMDFPLPRRYGSAVPECQIIVLGEGVD
ncbi:hypothetical protein HDU67_001708, partial [Dinochytrium kinnereticum]